MKILLLLLSLSAHADWAKLPSKEFSLPPPPADGSEAYAHDFHLLHAYETTRREEDCALSRRQHYPTFDSLFGRGWGALGEEEAALVEPLLEKSMGLAERVADYHKGKFLRARPYDTDPTLTPCGKKPGGAKSYPSSHASSAAAGACVLSMLFPSKAEQILAYGKYLGELRAIVGVHHPSDVAAGRALGEEICKRLQQESDFKIDFTYTKERLP